MKRLALIAAAVALVGAACSPQFQDLEGIEPTDPDTVTLYRNIDGFPNVLVFCVNGDALIMRSQKYNDLQILHIPSNDNNLCAP